MIEKSLCSSFPMQTTNTPVWNSRCDLPFKCVFLVVPFVYRVSCTVEYNRQVRRVNQDKPNDLFFKFDFANWNGRTRQSSLPPQKKRQVINFRFTSEFTLITIWGKSFVFNISVPETGILVQYHGCWCPWPGSLCHQFISSHGTP